jgi:hypothetical protein
MPVSLQLEDLGLVREDLDRQALEEERRKEEEDRRSKTVKFGSSEIQGGTSGALQAVVDALREGLESKAFQKRSGAAILNPFPDGDNRERKPGKGRKSDEDPIPDRSAA